MSFSSNKYISVKSSQLFRNEYTFLHSFSNVTNKYLFFFTVKFKSHKNSVLNLDYLRYVIRTGLTMAVTNNCVFCTKYGIVFHIKCKFEELIF